MASVGLRYRLSGPADTVVVETARGKFRGRRTGDVRIFRGIPYARPPLGPLRFRAPEPAEPRAGLRDALRFSPAAPQLGTEAGPAGRLFRLIRGGVDEDCLYLNVWTAAEPGGGPGAGWPVIFYIHGGAFLLGAGSTFLYDGSEMARGGAVVVTFNYRLGPFGFLDLTRLAPEAGIPANLGLLDQLAALAWVRENIGAFGGDPDNVTLMGESAGAMSAAVHLAGGSRGLYRRAILESGAAANVSRPEEADRTAESFLRQLGLSRREWRLLLAAPTDEILVAHRRALPDDPARLARLPWQPSLDERLLPCPPLEAIAGGSAADVDLLIGSNRDEWKLFTFADLALRALGPTELARYVEQLLAAGGGPPDAAPEAVRIYRTGPAGARRTPYEAWVALRTDEYFRVPAAALAEAHARHGARTYAYRFDLAAPALPGTLGACHGLELPVVFGTLEHPLFRPLFLGSRSARRLSRTMREAWLAFAAGGRPRAGGLEEWPLFDADLRRTLRLGAGCGVETAPGEAARRFWSDLGWWGVALPEERGARRRRYNRAVPSSRGRP